MYEKRSLNAEIYENGKFMYVLQYYAALYLAAVAPLIINSNQMSVKSNMTDWHENDVDVLCCGCGAVANIMYANPICRLTHSIPYIAHEYSKFNDCEPMCMYSWRPNTATLALRHATLLHFSYPILLPLSSFEYFARIVFDSDASIAAPVLSNYFLFHFTFHSHCLVCTPLRWKCKVIAYMLSLSSMIYSNSEHWEFVQHDTSFLRCFAGFAFVLSRELATQRYLVITYHACHSFGWCAWTILIVVSPCIRSGIFSRSVQMKYVCCPEKRMEDLLSYHLGASKCI